MPNLPTDNLYKFLAIGGIVLIGIGAFATDTALDTTYERTLAAQESLLERLYEQEELEGQVDEAWVAMLMNVPGLDSLVGLQLPALEDVPSDEWSDSMFAIIRDLRRQVNSEAAEVRGEITRTKTGQAEDALARAKSVYRMSLWMIAIGFVSAAFGFSMWYLRVQRYQDELTLLQLAEARSQLLVTRAELWQKQRDLL